jgi:hypothetical protein
LPELNEFQGNLKIRDDIDVDRITNSIIKFGFAFPIFVWRSGEENYIIDGHGRKLALEMLKERGYEIPDIPVVYIEAETKQQAKELLLRQNSKYGTVDNYELALMVRDIEDNVGELGFQGITAEFLNELIEQGEGYIKYDPELEPVFDTSEVDDEDIEKTEKKLQNTVNPHEMVKLNCEHCDADIFIKKDTIIRYLKGECV